MDWRELDAAHTRSHRVDEDEKPLKSYPSRPRLSLDGEFRFTFDPHDRGVREEWFKRTDLPAGRIMVPAPWQTVLRTHEPVGWYWKRFAVPPTFKDSRAFIAFGAADAVAEVWVNGRKIGRHVGGYVPFSLDVTEAVQRSGSNLLAVRVVDVAAGRPLHPDIPPDLPRGGQADDGEISGLWQSIYLEGRAAVSIGELSLRTHIDPPRLDIACEVALPELRGQPVELEGRLLTRQGEPITRARIPWDPGTGGPIGMTLAPESGKVAVWSPERPELYLLEVEVFLKDTGQDLARLHVGFRTVEAAGSHLVLNGAPLYVRGILDPVALARGVPSPSKPGSLPDELLRYRAQGFNLVRTYRRPFRPPALDACDEIGLLVWEETPLADGAPWESVDGNGRRGAAALAEVEDLIRRDRHHPSLVIWGITSENAQSTTVHGGRWMHHLCNRIRELDPNALVIENSDPFHFGAGTARSDILDFHLYRDAPLRECPKGDDAPVSAPSVSSLNSEFGAWGFPSLEGLERDERYADRISDLRTGFDQLGLGDTFPSVEDFLIDTQLQQFQSIKRQIEDFRLNSKVTGHVLNAAYDSGGRCMGIADPLARPRGFAERLRGLNAGLLAVVEWPIRNFWAGTDLHPAVVLSNRSGKRIETWRLSYRAGRSGLVLARGVIEGGSIPSGEYGGTDAISIPLPQLDAVTTFKLVLGCEAADNQLVENDWVFWVYPPIRDLPAFPVSVNVNGTWPGLWEVLPQLEAASMNLCDVLLAAGWDQTVADALGAGGAVILACERFEQGKVGSAAEVDRPLKTSFVRQNHPVFAEFPHCFRIDQRFQSLLPCRLMTGVQRPLAGYFREWDYLGAAMAEFRVGKGRLLVTTFRFDRLAEDPMAAHLLHAMIQYAAGEQFQPTDPLFL